MNSVSVLYMTVALMAVVAVACTVLCLVWSVPGWRRLLHRRGVVFYARVPIARGLIGWPARIGSGLVSVGIGVCALLAWYGCYCVLVVL